MSDVNNVNNDPLTLSTELKLDPNQKSSGKTENDALSALLIQDALNQVMDQLQQWQQEERKEANSDQ